MSTDEYREDIGVRINKIQSRGIILKGEDVLVMFRRKDGEEYYVFPGGHMREGEEPVENAIREIKEETTITVKDMHLAFKFENYIKPDNPNIDYYFVGSYESGTPKISGEESRRMTDDNYFEPMWVRLDDIEELNLYPLAAKEWVLEYLDKFLSKRETSGI